MENQRIANEHKAQFTHLFWDFIDKATGLRDLSGKILKHAILARAHDEDGSIGTSCMSEFVHKFGEVRLGNIDAVRDYCLWVFDTAPMAFDKDDKPIFDPSTSALRWSMKKNKFAPMKDEDENGKKTARPVDLQQVKTRLATCDWWAFNSAKPASPYKAKFATALKNDLKAYADEKWIPSKEELAFLKRVELLAKEMGFALDNGKK